MKRLVLMGLGLFTLLVPGIAIARTLGTCDSFTLVAPFAGDDSGFTYVYLTNPNDPALAGSTALYTVVRAPMSSTDVCAGSPMVTTMASGIPTYCEGFDPPDPPLPDPPIPPPPPLTLMLAPGETSVTALQMSSVAPLGDVIQIKYVVPGDLFGTGTLDDGTIYTQALNHLRAQVYTRITDGVNLGIAHSFVPRDSTR